MFDFSRITIDPNPSYNLIPSSEIKNHVERAGGAFALGSLELRSLERSCTMGAEFLSRRLAG